MMLGWKGSWSGSCALRPASTMSGYIWFRGLMWSRTEGCGSRVLVAVAAEAVLVASVAAFLALLAFPNREDSENLSLDASFITTELLLRLLEPTLAGFADGSSWNFETPKVAGSRRLLRGVKENALETSGIRSRDAAIAEADGWNFMFLSFSLVSIHKLLNQRTSFLVCYIFSLKQVSERSDKPDGFNQDRQ